MKAKECRSVIQPDFQDLLATGCYAVHHVFPGRNRGRCEKYGFLVALRPAAHEEAHSEPEGALMKFWQERAHEYWLENIGTEEELREEFL